MLKNSSFFKIGCYERAIIAQKQQEPSVFLTHHSDRMNMYLVPLHAIIFTLCATRGPIAKAMHQREIQPITDYYLGCQIVS
jgi:hypothetical protein